MTCNATRYLSRGMDLSYSEEANATCNTVMCRLFPVKLREVFPLLESVMLID